jgi:hypothetical protein
MSDTPRTDVAWSSGFDPVILSAAELARRLREQCAELERENAALREQIAALGEIACLNLDDATVAKCDAVTGGEKYRDVMHRLFVEQPKELAALRNEVARLSNRTQWLCTCGGSKASA